jgi:GT2 family glycosyltransferase
VSAPAPLLESRVPRNDWHRVPVPEVGQWTPSMRVSVVIPAKGSQRTLDRCLAALRQQTYPAELTDIVVVDDVSEPPLTVSGHAGEPVVRLVRHEPHGTFGAGKARNTGAAATDGDVLVLLDADVLVARTFIEEHARWHHVVPYAAVTGVIGFADFEELDDDQFAEMLRADDLESFGTAARHDGQEWRDRHFQRTHDLVDEAHDLFRSTVGAVTSVRRSLFDSVGGYREVGVRGVEDTEFGYRLHQHGALLVLDRSSRLWHQGRRSYDSGKRAAINEARRPYVEDLIPVTGMRPEPAERRHPVPRLVVRVGSATTAEVRATVEAVGRWPQLDTWIVLDPDQRDSLGGVAAAEAGPLLVCEHDCDPVDLAAAPFQITFAGGTTPGAEVSDTIVDLLRQGPIGVLHVLAPTGGEVATGIWSRAVGRARVAGCPPGHELAVAGELFDERWVHADRVALAVAAPAPGAADTGEVDVAHESSGADDFSEADESSGADDPGEVEFTEFTEVDVLYVTDLRFPGGTSSSLVDEVVAASRHGRRVAVLHMSSPSLGTGLTANRRVRALIDRGDLISVLPGEPVRCRLAVVKHPMVMSVAVGGRLPVDADRVVVVAGQVPGHDDGTQYYQPAQVHLNVTEAFGQAAEWWPVSTVVRRTLHDVPLSSGHWSEVLDPDDWLPSQPRTPGPELVIGRHGRPDPLKWPATAEQILAVYPGDPGGNQGAPQIRVRILGAPDEIAHMLGGYPPNWEVLAFGSVDVRDYLSSIDVFVYFHHPDLVEAFGRTVLEAVAAGLPAVVPEHFEELFGDACLYAQPHEVAGLLERIRTDPDFVDQQRARAHRVVAERFSHHAFLARLDDLLGADGDASSGSEGAATNRAVPRPDLVTDRQRADRPTVLVSCLGATRTEVDHVLRSIDSHRRRDLGFIPLVVTTMSLTQLSSELGIETAVILPRRNWNEDEPWETYAQRRLRQLAVTYRIDNVVAWDSTHPDAWLALSTRPRPGVPAEAS